MYRAVQLSRGSFELLVSEILPSSRGVFIRAPVEFVSDTVELVWRRIRDNFYLSPDLSLFRIYLVSKFCLEMQSSLRNSDIEEFGIDLKFCVRVWSNVVVLESRFGNFVLTCVEFYLFRITWNPIWKCRTWDKTMKFFQRFKLRTDIWQTSFDLCSVKERFEINLTFRARFRNCSATYRQMSSTSDEFFLFSPFCLSRFSSFR